jgi:hypothetical protein
MVVRKLVPIPVKPYSGDGTITSEQFCQLGLHKCDIMVPVAFSGSSCAMARPAGFILIVASIPVKQGVINK